MRALWLVVLIVMPGVFVCGEREDLTKIQLGSCTLLLLERCTGNVNFSLYNHIYRDTPKDLDVQFPDTGEGFDPSLPFKLIILGYGGGVPEIDPTPLLKDAYLERENMNVVTVLYPTTVAVDIFCYAPAVFNVGFVSQCVVQLLLNMEKYYPGFRIDDVHVIGFSLGTPISGIAAHQIFKQTGRKFRRITGLDMAKPFFLDLTVPLIKDLDKTDAHFVDVIHTNGGFMGKLQPNGHVDFYVNNGTYQAACLNNPRMSLCSHLLAVLYMAESVNTKTGFWGLGCDGDPQLNERCTEWNGEVALMGEHTPPSTRGIFYVDANKKPPYAIGKQIFTKNEEK